MVPWLVHPVHPVWSALVQKCSSPCAQIHLFLGAFAVQSSDFLTSCLSGVPLCVLLIVPCKAHKDKALGAGASPVSPVRCLTEFSVAISYSPCPGLGRVRGIWLLTLSGCLVMGSEEVQAVQKHWHSSLLYPAKVNYCKNGAKPPFPLFNRLFLETAISSRTGFPLIRQSFVLIF